MKSRFYCDIRNTFDGGSNRSDSLSKLVEYLINSDCNILCR